MTTQPSHRAKGAARRISGKKHRAARGKLIAAIEALEPRKLFTGSPTGLGVSEDSNGYENLAWTAPSGPVDNYEVLSSPDGSTFTPITSSIPSSSTTYSVTAPTYGAAEYFEVVAIASGVPSSPSGAVNFTPRRPPVATGGSFTTVHDTALNITASSLALLGSDPAGLSLTACLQTGTTPEGGTVTYAGSGNYTYTPPAAWMGTDTLSYTLSNGTASSRPAALAISVTDQAPQAGDVWVATVNTDPTDSSNAAPAVSADCGGFNGISATDADGDSLTYHLVNADGSPVDSDTMATSHGSVELSSSGNYTYTPGNGFIGYDRFYYVANDGILNSNVASVTINVQAGVPLIAVPDYAYYNPIPGDPCTFPMVGGQYQNVDLSQFAVLSSPSSGTLVAGSDGTVTYAATAGGLYSFTFGFGDDVPSSTEYIDVDTGYDATWEGLGDPGYSDYAVLHSAVLSEGATTGGLVTGVEYAPDPGADLSIQLLSGPASGTLDLGSDDGSFTYTPGLDNRLAIHLLRGQRRRRHQPAGHRRLCRERRHHPDGARPHRPFDAGRPAPQPRSQDRLRRLRIPARLADHLHPHRPRSAAWLDHHQPRRHAQLPAQGGLCRPRFLYLPDQRRRHGRLSGSRRGCCRIPPARQPSSHGRGRRLRSSGR